MRSRSAFVRPSTAVRQQTRAGNCRAGVLSGVIAVKPERGTDESAVPLITAVPRILALSQQPLQDRPDAFTGPPRPACTIGPDSSRSLLRDSRSSSRCSRAAARLRLEVRRVVQNEPNCPTNTPSSAPKTTQLAHRDHGLDRYAARCASQPQTHPDSLIVTPASFPQW